MTVICPYCDKPAVFQESSAHLWNGRDFGPVYECTPCGARISARPDTKEPKGTLANSATRKLRQQAHKIFDPLWRGKMRRDRCSQDEARTAGYRWLAAHLRISYEACHISQMQEAQLLVVIDVCERLLPVPKPPAPPEEVKS